MLAFNGYIPLRRGLLEHLREGRITLREYEVFTILLLWADARTGIATTNGPGLVFLSGHQLNLDYTQKCLASLEKKGYLKRPFYVQGQRGDQKIFIDKYVCTAGPLRLKQLSFARTTDWENPAYENITEDTGESAAVKAGVNTSVNAASNENRKEKQEKMKEEIEREGEGEGAAQPQADQETPVTSSSSTVSDSDVQRLCEVLSTYTGNPVTDEWKKSARAILRTHELSGLKKLLEWMFVESDFWPGVTHTMMNLFGHLEKGVVIKKYEAARLLANKRAAKTKEAAAASDVRPEFKKDTTQFLKGMDLS